MAATSFKATTLYKKAFEQAMAIFEITKKISKRGNVFPNRPSEMKQQKCLCQFSGSLP